MVASHPDSAEILVSPEITGISLYRRLKQPTRNILQYVAASCNLRSVCVLNIMRGGLNFPVEESSYDLGLNVKGISFVTTERIVKNDVPGCKILDSKIMLCNDATFVIGDIVATGETFRETVRCIVDLYSRANLQIKRIVLVTFGTVEALRIVNGLNREIRERWNDFEGIITVFYEGIFSAYTTSGITGLNMPWIDFLPNGGFLCPEYRHRMIERENAPFEKCAIYDGGDRRFEPGKHIDALLVYWENLNIYWSKFQLPEFVAEKFGYGSDCSYEDWLKFNSYTCLKEDSSYLFDLFNKERHFLQKLTPLRFADLCHSRYEEIALQKNF